MAEKGFGVKEVNLIGASGTPTITSPNNLNLNAVNVAISTNASIGGNLTVSGTVGIAGTLTYEDVTNIDSVGIVTARSGIDCNGDIDVDGHTNLDNVSIAGVTTFGNNITASGTSRFEIASMENALLDGEIAHTGDTNTLIKFPSNDNISFDTSGTTRLNINNSGATVTGTLSATTFSGSGASLTGIAVTEAPVTDYTITGDGSHYYFHGGGVDETAGDPDLYLIRGQKYRFNNTTGSSHPFEFRAATNGSAYTNGVTGDDEGVQFFTVPYDAPAKIFYICTVHSGMVGNIYIRGAGGQNHNVGVTTFRGEISLTEGTSSPGNGGEIGSLMYTFPSNDNKNAKIAALQNGGSSGADLAFFTRTQGDATNNDGGEERLRIASNGRVGINESTPLGKLHVKSGDSGATVGASADELVLESSANTGMTILSGTTSEGAINFGDSGDNNIGKIVYTHNGNYMYFKTNDTERLRIASDGTIHVNSPDTASGGRIWANSSALLLQSGNGRQTLKVSDAAAGVNRTIEMTSAGNLKFPAGATIGIDFSAKTNLGGATDTTLAHYEEGTWTPSFANLDVPSHVTTNWATYTRVGRVVTISVKFTVSSSINDASGFGFTLPYGPISDRQIVIPAISDRSGSNKAPFAFNNVNSDHTLYAKALEGFAFQAYNLFSGNYIIVTGSYETDA